MRVVIQRVIKAEVIVEGKICGQINHGLLIFAGITDEDDIEDIKWLSNKIVNLRIFDDEQKVTDISIKETGGEILLVSQFTLYASTKKGNRPGYIKASKPPIAIPLYNSFKSQLEADLEKTISTGIFGADMKVALVNDGPVTLIIDSKNKE